MTTRYASSATRGSKKNGQRKQANPLIGGIEAFLHAHHFAESAATFDVEATELPKRFTIYEPMLLLPPSFLDCSLKWQMIYKSLTPEQSSSLFDTIISTFSKAGHPISHVAINAPISRDIIVGEEGTEHNRMRSPINLSPLYGDFGPSALLSANSTEPTGDDFKVAFWVETSQLTGVKQTWAPRWTMFSRGNIREKARILGVTQQNPSPFVGLADTELGGPLAGVDIVDMYVGIGYFAIPYLKRGARRVFGWEINGWSVEALRRGCERNGIECEVVKVDSDACSADIQKISDHVMRMLVQRTNLRCIIFWGDNRMAGDTMITLSGSLYQSAVATSVRHCNLGLLPSSQGSWKAAVKVLDRYRGGWLHIHENADIEQVTQKRLDIQAAIRAHVDAYRGSDWLVVCEHTEMVKTYAPGVGHFVFDIRIRPP